ncbi:hypothetical protein ACPEH1_09705 [Stenotrophomonas sp. NPDC077421]|uniref:hypothetical protein n=1 Tax=unclassified Stenotrophomonas TaxID=196198 RepID=UPI002897F486|nr:hypothetical protein [Stenotrophomonas sp.]
MITSRRLQERASRALPARLGRCAVLAGEGAGDGWPSPLQALPGARVAPGLMRFSIAAETRAAVLARGLAFLRDARQARGSVPQRARCAAYRPWQEGAAALAEAGIDGLPADWPQYTPVYGTATLDRSRWLLLMPVQGVLWYGWRA